MKIEDKLECYVKLWEKLDQTYREFDREYRRFCVRSILRSWLGRETPETFIREVCLRSGLEGYQLLSRPDLYPHKHRMFLQALVSTTLNIGKRQVTLEELDTAFTQAFGGRGTLNVNKKKK